jgi:asparagine synthase (glutamine-hydrolysing)
MCGIAGFANFVPTRQQTDPDLSVMIGRLRHRGPDGTGYFSAPGVGFAHARLSIIDLTGGKQPIHNEDRQIWVTFNGEIFNYLELRSQLEAAGHRFYTRTDTEVLVHAYEQWGLDFVSELNGQFAFALWDNRLKRLVLVRDRVGILPLFYVERPTGVVFASEIKALLPVCDTADRLVPAALDEVLTFWAPISPRTLFPGVYEVSPGQILVLENGQLRRQRYWDWTYPADGEHSTDDPARLAEELRALLIDATRLRLRSDVPVGAYLSGGLDSSVLTTIIGRHTDAQLRTFSIGFSDSSFDETPYQDELIAHLGARHSRVRCDSTHIAGAFQKAVYHGESTVLRTAPVPMLLLSGLVREQKYRVVLTGEGSDEVLGGYDLFKETKIRQFWARQPQSEWRPALLRRLYPYLELSSARNQAFNAAFFGIGIENPAAPFFSHLPRWTTTARCKEFFSKALRADLNGNAVDRIESTLPDRWQSWHWFNRAQYLESRGLMAGYLLSSQGDRMLMANSVEGRFPFLDHRLIEFTRRLPPSLLMRGLNEKYLLKKAFGSELPAAIVARPKQPYRAPGIGAFFTGTWQDETRELLTRKRLEEYGYFDGDRVERLVKKIEVGRQTSERDNMAFCAILSTQMLHREFIDQRHTNEASDATAGTSQALHSQ